MTGSDVVTEARYILNDVSGVRWTDAEMLKWVSAAQREIVRRRPEARFASSVLATDLSNPSALSDTLEIEEDYKGPMTDYICYRCFQKDADFSTNRKRAEDHFKFFIAGIS